MSRAASSDSPGIPKFGRKNLDMKSRKSGKFVPITSRPMARLSRPNFGMLRLSRYPRRDSSCRRDYAIGVLIRMRLDP